MTTHPAGRTAPETGRNKPAGPAPTSAPRPSPRPPSRALVTAATILLLAGCSAPVASTPASPGATAQGTSSGLPSPHVHGIAIDPADDTVYLATHDGLFSYGTRTPTRVGPIIDLMGFAAAGPTTFYASGHPGPGTALPNPVGLLTSADAGRTWQPLSRQGESDFHALTAAPFGVIAADQALRITEDGRSWRELPIPQPAIALAAAPDGGTILAATDAGPLRSTTRGDTWAPVDGAPPLQLLAWADADTAVGTTYDGAVHISDDAGRSWSPRARVGPAQAITARAGADGNVRVLIVTGSEILESADGGVTFHPWVP